MENDPQLSQIALDLLVDPGNELLLSPATYWELAIKISIRKYQLADPLADYIASRVKRTCIEKLEEVPVAGFTHASFLLSSQP